MIWWGLWHALSGTQESTGSLTIESPPLLLCVDEKARITEVDETATLRVSDEAVRISAASDTELVPIESIARVVKVCP